MIIKAAFNERVEIDAKEWTDETRVFLKPLSGPEMLVFNDLLLDFYDRDKTPDERYEAAIKAGIIGLVDETDAPLLTEADAPALKVASFLPFTRMFNAAASANRGKELDTAKKN